MALRKCSTQISLNKQPADLVSALTPFCGRGNQGSKQPVHCPRYFSQEGAKLGLESRSMGFQRATTFTICSHSVAGARRHTDHGSLRNLLSLLCSFRECERSSHTHPCMSAHSSSMGSSQKLETTQMSFRCPQRETVKQAVVHPHADSTWHMEGQTRDPWDNVGG